MVKISFGDSMSAEATDNPMDFTPRFNFPSLQVIVAGYTSPGERDRQLAGTFGSQQWLWSEDEHFRFDKGSRELSSATFFVPRESAPPQVSRYATVWPRTVPGGLRADAAQNFALPRTTVFCCDLEATELRCFRDPGVLDRPLDARIGIAPDVGLLVQRGAVVGWSLTDPARYLTDGFADAGVIPPSPATRHRLAECLALISEPLVDQVMDQEPDAWRKLRATERALGEQQEDRHRADILYRVVSRLIEDYES